MWPLRTVGVLYLMSGLWCTVQYQLASAYVGYSLDGSNGIVEFLSVYGGIQIGLALALLYFSLKPEQAPVAVIFGLFISLGLLVFRLVSIWVFGGSQALLLMALIESLIVLLLFYQKHLQRCARCVELLD